VVKRHRWFTPAADVLSLRAALGLSQGDFAAALGLSRRTVIRAEARGLELPWRPDSSRGEVLERWGQLRRQAGDRQRPRSPAKCHTEGAR
jgi:hypothetical protein